MGIFPDAWMSELLSKSDIVSLVSQYTALKPKGRRLWGCCPFHSEKTPSFSVTPENQLYYCFGCHAGGNVIHFVMEIERLTYIEAVKFLAQRAGMELPDEINDDRLRKERDLKEKLYAVCREAALYYHKMLLGHEGEKARSYLAKRGIDGQISTAFGLGYAPDGWDGLLNHMKDKGYSPETLVSAGLAIHGKKGGCYDAYRDRIIFPIISTMRRVLGFGARTMGDDTPKYINTGDTPIFNKRNNLYAMNLQRGKSLSDLIMVEGYMDVITLYKSGITNVVASLGTALTQQQARLIKRYVNRVYISYDGDSAGQNATLRGLDILDREGLDVRVIVIPDGLDPDDFIKERGAEEYLDIKARALSLNAFKLDSLMSGIDMNTPDGREEYAKKACTMLGKLQPVEQERYGEVVARRTGLSMEAIIRQSGLSGGVEQNIIGNNRNTKQKTRDEAVEINKTEITLLCCIIQSDEALLSAMGRMAENGIAFSTEEINDFANRLLADCVSGSKPDISLMIAELPKDAADIVSAAIGSKDSLVNPVATAEDCVDALTRENLEKRIETLALQIQEDAGDSVKNEFRELTARLNSLK